MRGVAPRLAVASSQMGRLLNSGDPASAFDEVDTFPEQSSAPSGSYDRKALRVGDGGVSRDLPFDAALTEIEIVTNFWRSGRRSLDDWRNL